MTCMFIDRLCALHQSIYINMNVWNHIGSTQIAWVKAGVGGKQSRARCASLVEHFSRATTFYVLMELECVFLSGHEGVHIRYTNIE